MKFEIAHELPGRLRLRCGEGAFTLPESLVVASLLEQLDGVERVKASFRTGSLLILHNPRVRDTVLEAVRTMGPEFYGGIDGAELADSPEGGLWDGLWGLLGGVFVRSLLPSVLRCSLTVLRAVPLLVRGTNALCRRKLNVSVLDASAVGVSLLRRDFRTATVITTLLALGVRRGFRGSRFFRSVFFLPFITSLALVGSVLKWIFSMEGPWSDLMAPFGLGGSWLASTVLVMPAVIVVGVWSRFGYGMLILVAALQEVPLDLEEAALMDGAGAWSRFRHILLPTIRPALFFLAVIEVTFAFQVFDVIYVMTSGGPANASYSMVFLLYDQGFRYSDYGYAAAAGVALFVMTLVVALIQRLFLGRRS